MSKDDLTQAVGDADAQAQEKEKLTEYVDREQGDAELMSAIADILSAEEEAKRIIASAEATVKAIQLDGATAERDMRMQSNKAAADAHDRAIADAETRAKAEREKLVASAAADGEKLFASKKKDIDKAADELFRALGGKA